MFCMTCGAQNNDDARFCFSCGAELVASVAAAAPEGAVEKPAVQEDSAIDQVPEESLEGASEAQEPDAADQNAEEPTVEEPTPEEPDAVSPERDESVAQTPAPQESDATDPKVDELVAAVPGEQGSVSSTMAEAPQGAPAAPFMSAPPSPAQGFSAPPQAPYAPQTPPGVMAGAPAAGAPAPKATNRKILFIALIALAALFVITGIVSVVMRVSGHSDQPNLDTIVKGEPSEIAATFEGLDAVKLHDETYYTRPEWKGTIQTAVTAIVKDKSKDLEKVAADIRDHSMWAVAIYEDDSDRNVTCMKVTDLQRKGNPSLVSFVTVRALNDPTPDDIRKMVQEVAEINSLRIGTQITSKGESDLGAYTYSYGIGEGPGTFITVKVNELQGIYEIVIAVYHTDEFKTDYPREVLKRYETNCTKWFNGEYTFPQK